MKDTKSAFKWIVNILKEHKIPFQITGGLAAIAYGSKRLLNDIDIEIPEIKMESLAKAVKKYIIYGPTRYVDDNWDIALMTLKYEGQEIDICGDTSKMRRAKNDEWTVNTVDFSEFETKKLFDLDVPVMRKDVLVKFKTVLGRKTDTEDIKQIQNFNKNMISFEEFKKVELKIGKILEAEKVEGSDKLVKLQVDLGEEKRQIVAGIAQAYEPDKLIGREIVVVANLEPRNLKGIESQGMLLAADGKEAGPVLLSPEKEVPPGSEVR